MIEPVQFSISFTPALDRLFNSDMKHLLIPRSQQILLTNFKFSAQFLEKSSFPNNLGNGPNTVSESTVSDTELSEIFGPHQVAGRELSEFLLACYLCAKANSLSFSQNSLSLPQNSVRLSEFSSPKQYASNSIPPFPRFLGPENPFRTTQKKNREVWNCQFQKTPPQAVSSQVFRAGLPFPVPEILEFVAFRDSGKLFQQFSRDFPGVFFENPRTTKNNSQGVGKKKPYTALFQCRTFLCRKKWGPPRKDFGGGYGFVVFIGFLYPPPAWKVFLWGQKSSPNDFFRWWLCTLFSSLGSYFRNGFLIWHSRTFFTMRNVQAPPCQESPILSLRFDTAVEGSHSRLAGRGSATNRTPNAWIGAYRQKGGKNHRFQTPTAQPENIYESFAMNI